MRKKQTAPQAKKPCQTQHSHADVQWPSDMEVAQMSLDGRCRLRFSLERLEQFARAVAPFEERSAADGRVVREGDESRIKQVSKKLMEGRVSVVGRTNQENKQLQATENAAEKGYQEWRRRQALGTSDAANCSARDDSRALVPVSNALVQRQSEFRNFERMQTMLGRSTIHEIRFDCDAHLLGHESGQGRHDAALRHMLRLSTSEAAAMNRFTNWLYLRPLVEAYLLDVTKQVSNHFELMCAALATQLKVRNSGRLPKNGPDEANIKKLLDRIRSDTNLASCQPRVWLRRYENYLRGNTVGGSSVLAITAPDSVKSVRSDLSKDSAPDHAKCSLDTRNPKLVPGLADSGATADPPEMTEPITESLLEKPIADGAETAETAIDNNPTASVSPAESFIDPVASRTRRKSGSVVSNGSASELSDKTADNGGTKFPTKSVPVNPAARQLRMRKSLPENPAMSDLIHAVSAAQHPKTISEGAKVTSRVARGGGKAASNATPRGKVTEKPKSRKSMPAISANGEITPVVDSTRKHAANGPKSNTNVACGAKITPKSGSTRKSGSSVKASEIAPNDDTPVFSALAPKTCRRSTRLAQKMPPQSLPVDKNAGTSKSRKSIPETSTKYDTLVSNSPTPKTGRQSTRLAQKMPPQSLPVDKNAGRSKSRKSLPATSTKNESPVLRKVRVCAICARVFRFPCHLGRHVSSAHPDRYSPESVGYVDFHFAATDVSGVEQDFGGSEIPKSEPAAKRARIDDTPKSLSGTSTSRVSERRKPAARQTATKKGRRKTLG